VEGAEGGLLEGGGEGGLHRGGAGEDLERIVRGVPEPFRLVAVDRRGAGGEGVEPHLDEGERPRRRTVAEDRAGELSPGEEGLDEGRLGVRLVDLGRPPEDGIQVVAEGARRDPLARPLVERLDHGGDRDPRRVDGADDSGGAGISEDDVLGGRDAAGAKDLLRPALVEGEGESEGIAAGERDVVELADRGDVGFAIRAVEALGDVEDDVGAGLPQAEREIGVGFEPDHIAGAAERPGDGVDGLGCVPLRVAVVGPGTRRFVFLRGLLVVRESDAERHRSGFGAHPPPRVPL